jgi:DNA-binding response OmpR family regulator
VQILVAHPDRQVRHMLAEGLYGRWSTTRVVSVASAQLVLRVLRAERPDVVVLATELADGPALEVVREIRRLSDAFVLLLAPSASDAEQIQGLQVGADDYLVQPLSAAVLAARIDALRRRGGGSWRSEARPDFRSGALAVWFRQRVVTVRGAPVKLTPIEFRLLRELAAHAGEIVPTQVLLDRVWGDGYGATSVYLKVFVNRLRAKLGRGAQVPEIQTMRGVGYGLGMIRSTLDE